MITFKETLVMIGLMALLGWFGFNLWKVNLSVSDWTLKAETFDSQAKMFETDKNNVDRMWFWYKKQLAIEYTEPVRRKNA